MPFLPPNCMVHDCLFIYMLQLATISGGRSPIHHLETRLVACSKAPVKGISEHLCSLMSVSEHNKYTITVGYLCSKVLPHKVCSNTSVATYIATYTRHCQIAVLVCLRDIISLNLHVYVNFYVDHEDLLLLHVKVSILDLMLHH